MERAERSAVPGAAPSAVAFRDGLGERRQIVDPIRNETLELLCVRPELAAVPSFEFALRERVSRLAGFRHAHYARVRSVERLTDGAATLAVVSDCIPGIRLSDMLARVDERKLSLDISTALGMLRQLVPAVEMLHESAREIAHGALAPERLIVTPSARVIVSEYVMSAALEQLRFPNERYWTELRVALPRATGTSRFDQRTDVTQLGVVALSLILGRPLRSDEYPARIVELLASTWAVSARGGFEPLPPGLRAWLGRALQLDPRNAFASMSEARVEFEKVLGDSEYIASPSSLEAFLARHFPPEKATAQAAAPRPAPLATAATPAGGTARPQAVPTPAAPVPPPAPRAADPRPAADLHATADHERGEPHTVKERPSRWSRWGIVAAVVVAIAVAGVTAGRRYLKSAPPVAQTGTLVITTNPPGAEALVNGEPKGVTPLTLTLPPGSHTLELRAGGEPRTIPVTIAAGAQVAQYVDLPTALDTDGQLQVQTQPPGAQVAVDGVVRGTTPTTVAGLTPGEHIVTLESDLGSVKQIVLIESGVTASLVVPLAAPEGAPVSGWISVASPIVVQLHEKGRLLGSSQSERIMVAAGRHDVEIVNDVLGYRATRTVQVAAGKVASISIDVPKGFVALNATPWAEVWVDGERIGETPIGNLSLPIGQHSILFRHPELGEQHHMATVTLKDVTRLSVDLRKR